MLSDFLADLVVIAPSTGAKTYAFNRRSGQAIGYLQLVPESPRILLIHRIWTLEPHHGDGSAMLGQLCELADRHGIILKLKAMPFGSKPYPLSRQALVDWYERHGFERVGRWMMREPRRGRSFASESAAAYIGE